MDTFTIWMLCIVGMMALYGIFAVWFLVTGKKNADKKPAQSADSSAETKLKDAAN
jgi:hypothetical protein